MNTELLDTKIAAVRRFFDTYGSAAIAFSGGVDSTLVLKLAYDQLGERAVAVTAVGESLPGSELQDARRLAAAIGARHVELKTYEMDDPRYVANPANRCYFCKTETYTQLGAFVEREHLAVLVDGTNADDARDIRPGRQAAREHGVQSPLAEAGLTKEEIRLASKEMGLTTWDKPALACLSSRIPYGTAITVQALTQVDRAELYLRSLGIRQVRVRHLADTARIEVEPDDMARVVENRQAVVAYLNALGFASVTLDLEGYRTGRLNEALRLTQGRGERPQ